MTKNLIIFLLFIGVFLLPQSIRAQDSLKLLTTIMGERECASAGDVNGDGFKDIITGYPGDGGYVKIFFGSVEFDTTPDLLIMGDGGSFGSEVGCAGDLNKDGYYDIIVGAPSAFNPNNGAEMAGKAHIYFGGSPMDTVVDLILQDSDWYYSFGSSVTSAGDVNNDGYDDAMVAAPDDWGAVGRVFIYLGGENMDSIYDIRIEGHPDSAENLGWSVAGVGDINSDGYDDILIGSPKAGVSWGTGRVSVFFGGDPMDTIPDVTFCGDSIDFRNFGREVSSAGDVNNDGIQDILIGGKSGYPKFAKLYISKVEGEIIVFDTLNLFGEDIMPSTFGLSLSSAGDINKDGFDDFMIADYDNGIDLKGIVYVFYGSQDVDSTWDIALVGDERPEKAFGLDICFIGDLNGDANDEIMIASYGDSGYAGKIFIYYSSVTSVNDKSIKKELNSFHLRQNYPNPFNPETVIEYVLPKNSQVNLSIYNILGQHIKTLIDEYQKTGYRKVIWYGKDQTGRQVSSGIYFCKLRTESFIDVKKMLLLR